MAKVHAETCSIYVAVTQLIKINLCYVRLSICTLFSNKHNIMASIKISLEFIAINISCTCIRSSAICRSCSINELDFYVCYEAPGVK